MTAPLTPDLIVTGWYWGATRRETVQLAAMLTFTVVAVVGGLWLLHGLAAELHWPDGGSPGDVDADAVYLEDLADVVRFPIERARVA